MSTARALLSVGSAIAFTLGGGEKLAFDPEAGSTITKTFVMGGDFALDDISLIVSGQDIGGMIGQIEVGMKHESRIVVTDTYQKVVDGRPTGLDRTFDELSGKVTMEITPAEMDIPEIESVSALEGKTVAFRWNEEEQGYDRSFAQEGGDESLLEELDEDMDLRVFLPGKEIATGDSWTVELAELQSVFMPGGNLQLLPEDMAVDSGNMEVFEELFGSFGEEFGDLLEGECTCTFKGTSEQDGARVAEIAIEVEVAAALDLSGFLDKVMRKAIEQSGEDVPVEFSIDTADLSFDFQGSGTLLWRLEQGRMHSFQTSGDATIEMDLAVGVDVEGESQELDASLEMSGTFQQEIATKE